MKKGFIIAAIVLTVAGIALFTVALASAGFDLSKLSGEKYETNTYTVEEEFTSISITTKRADVIFKASADGKVKIICEETEKVRHSASVEEGTLVISAADKRNLFDYVTIFAKRLSVTVYLPSGSYDSLDLKNDTGNVTIPADFSFGDVNVDLSTGDVLFNAAECGKLTVKTDTGDVTVAKTAAKSAEIKTATGKISLSSLSCEGDVSIKVNTGKTELTDVTCKNLVSEGDTGDITLKNVIASGNFNIERDTGDVRFDGCDAAEIYVKTDTGDVTGSLLTDKVFFTETDTGKNNVPKTTGGGKCEITSDTGDIIITITK